MILDGIGGSAVPALAAVAAEAHLQPDACEVPLPRCFKEERQQVGCA